MHLRGVLLLCGATYEGVFGAVSAGIAFLRMGPICWKASIQDVCNRFQAPPRPWFVSDRTKLVLWVGIVLAAAVIPFGIALASKGSGHWIVLCAVAADASVGIGLPIGGVVGSLMYPAKYAGGDWGDVVAVSLIGAVIGLPLAALPAAIFAALGVIAWSEARVGRVSMRGNEW